MYDHYVLFYYSGDLYVGNFIPIMCLRAHVHNEPTHEIGFAWKILSQINLGDRFVISILQILYWLYSVELND